MYTLVHIAQLDSLAGFDAVTRFGGHYLTHTITAVLVVVQVLTRRFLKGRTLSHLEHQSTALETDQAEVHRASAPLALPRERISAEAGRALRAAFPLDPKRAKQPIDEAFSAEALLPDGYNARLDAASPGLFTALGILGTFIGLLIAFLAVDANDAANSITPLLRGMNLAFVNSIIGVMLSIDWTVRSRTLRHAHDVRARALATTVRERFGDPGGDTQVLAALASIEQSVAKSSETISSNLIEALQDLVKKMVEMPFDELGKHVGTFGTVVSASMEAHTATQLALSDSLKAMEAARQVITDAATSATIACAELGPVANTLAEHARQASELLTRTETATATAAAALERITGHMEAQKAVVQALHAAAEGMQAQKDGLQGAHGEFREASAALRSAVTELGATAPAIAKEAFTTFREQLAESVTGFAKAFQTTGDRTVEAMRGAAETTTATVNEASTAVVSQFRVAGEVSGAAFRESGKAVAENFEKATTELARRIDAHFSDLGDRYIAQLETHVLKLPEAAAEIVQAVAAVRSHLGAAVGKLDGTLNRMDKETSAELRERLKQFDALLAEAVDRFSTTLATWDDQVGKLDERLNALHEESMAAGARRKADADLVAGFIASLQPREPESREPAT
jgi:hypothetical protein